MTDQHRKDRAAQKAYQEKRWNAEQAVRASRIRKGFKGLWDKLTFKYWTLRKQNEKEAWTCHVRDRAERQELIEAQLDQRQNLQVKFAEMRQLHEQEMQKLTADMVRIATPEAERSSTPEVFRGKVKEADLGIATTEARPTQPPRPGRGKVPAQDLGS